MTRKLSVLFIAFAFPPENVVGALRPFRFAKNLHRAGHDVSVITASAQDGFRHEFPVCVVPDALTFWEKVLRKTLLPGEIGLSWAPRTIREGKRWLAAHPATVIFSTSPPTSTHLAALRLKRQFGLPWLADFRDPLVGNPVHLPVRAYFGDPVFERLILRNADLCIANTEAVAERWRKRYPQWKHKVHTIWNGFDPDERFGALPLPARPYPELVHVGEVYRGRHPQALVASMLRLVQSGRLKPSDIKIRLIGELEERSIPDRPALDKLVELGCLEIDLQTPQKEEGWRMLSEADSLLLLDWVSAEGGQQVPYKLYIYIQIGRPILALTARSSPVEFILSQSGIPYRCLYPDLTPEEVDRKVLEFLELPTAAATPSEWFLTNFNSVSQTEALAALLQSVASKEG